MPTTEAVPAYFVRRVFSHLPDAIEFVRREIRGFTKERLTDSDLYFDLRLQLASLLRPNEAALRQLCRPLAKGLNEVVLDLLGAGELPETGLDVGITGAAAVLNEVLQRRSDRLAKLVFYCDPRRKQLLAVRKTEMRLPDEVLSLAKEYQDQKTGLLCEQVEYCDMNVAVRFRLDDPRALYDRLNREIRRTVCLRSDSEQTVPLSLRTGFMIGDIAIDAPNSCSLTLPSGEQLSSRDFCSVFENGYCESYWDEAWAGVRYAVGHKLLLGGPVENHEARQRAIVQVLLSQGLTQTMASGVIEHTFMESGCLDRIGKDFLAAAEQITQSDLACGAMRLLSSGSFSKRAAGDLERCAFRLLTTKIDL